MARLEQVLELYQPRVQERERVYTISDLERLSASVLYTRPIEKYHSNYGDGISWGESFGKSTDYIKITSLGELHVHAPQGLVTGAKLDGKPISNYEACMIDLLPGEIKKNTGKW